MHSPFAYPFDGEWILKKRKALKKELLTMNVPRLPKKIAVLGGSTTHDIIAILELFLLFHGIAPSFYESAYAMYWQEAMFDSQRLTEFEPDLIFIHTTSRNITSFPSISMSKEEMEALFQEQFQHFHTMWDKLFERYSCPIIQNNFELPYYRLMGNQDIWDIHGRGHYIQKLNQSFYEYASSHENFYIHDIQYLSASFGLHQWAEPSYWNMYKYALSFPAIPEFCHSLANIIKSLYGKNKKAFVLDLDNTLWGGVIGDEGPEGIALGPDTPMGEAYREFQSYLKEYSHMGILLNISSKNQEENALAGLNHPDSLLKPEDFIVIKANWEPKDQNLATIAEELNILPESLVFVDDNPAEREIVERQFPGVSVPDIGDVEQYIRRIDGAGFFEVTSFSEDDKKRTEMYKENALRTKLEHSFSDYGEYLQSLHMTARIKDFEPLYMNRIVQLTNKSNQFNLTTKRYTLSEMESLATNPAYIRLYGKLEDKFGDNGVVSVIIGKKAKDGLHIELWLMSCRVLKRDMELAMLDKLVEESKKADIHILYGYYYKTSKNAMVKEFYGSLGFEKIREKDDGTSLWRLSIDHYENKNTVIQLLDEREELYEPRRNI